MKYFKIIFGAILGFATLSTLITVGSGESGAGFLGVLTVVILLGGLSFWLIYSGLNSKGEDGNKE